MLLLHWINDVKGYHVAVFNWIKMWCKLRTIIADFCWRKFCCMRIYIFWGDWNALRVRNRGVFRGTKGGVFGVKLFGIFSICWVFEEKNFRPPPRKISGYAPVSKYFLMLKNLKYSLSANLSSLIGCSSHFLSEKIKSENRKRCLSF